MDLLQGIPAHEGIAIGSIYVLGREQYDVTEKWLEDQSPEAKKAELERFVRAMNLAEAELEAAEAQFKDVDANLGVDALVKFQRDSIVQSLPQIQSRIESGYTAESAVQNWFKFIRKQLQQIEMMRSKITDVDAVESRLLRHLLGVEARALKDIDHQVIIAANDLDPATTAELPLDKVIGLVTATGGETSHTAIVARSRNIPAVVGIEKLMTRVTMGTEVVLDGGAGDLFFEPDERTIKKYKAIRASYLDYSAGLKLISGLPSQTVDGYNIQLLANIENPGEIESAIDNQAMGVGLYRTEFLYSDKNPNPSEKDHYSAYLEAVKELRRDDNGRPRPFVIRTLDLGADKFNPDKLNVEKNPFLGLRSIRWCLVNRDVFMRQLRAILRVSVEGDVRLMLPMVGSLDELLRARRCIEDAKRQLREKQIPYNENLPIGIMVEVPSTALIADILAPHVDFMSIGTNDLVGYTLAVDRVNERVQDYYRPAQVAIFQLLLQVIEAGRRANTRVSLCGEISGSLNFLPLLLGLGLRDLSMSPARIPAIKAAVRSLTMSKCLPIAREAFLYSESAEAEKFLLQKARELLPKSFR